jgi:hypothetical protein
MSLNVEDLEDQNRFRLILTIKYERLMEFVLEYIKKPSAFMLFFWSVCLIFLGIDIIVRFRIAGIYPYNSILLHSIIGFILLPLLCVPVHEFLHAIPLYLAGAKNIRVGMDLKQYMFYVSAHRHVAAPHQFWIIALTPFIVISLLCGIMSFFVPALWNWTLVSFIFVHATMCAGDFALLNFYYLNRNKKVYTWDDLDKKEAFFYERIA